MGSEFIGLAEWAEEMLECAPGSEGRCGGKQSVVKPFHAQFRTFTVCLCAYYATILSSLSPPCPFPTGLVCTLCRRLVTYYNPTKGDGSIKGGGGKTCYEPRGSFTNEVSALRVLFHHNGQRHDNMKSKPTLRFFLLFLPFALSNANKLCQQTGSYPT